MTPKTIMYCHGRGSSGRGSKATIIMNHFDQCNFVGNDYPTNDPIQPAADKPMPVPLHEMKELFWKNNKHNALGEIRLPLFFNELIKRL